MIKIKEEDYCLITNRVKISIAKQVLVDILPGFDGVIKPEELKEMIKNLSMLEQRLRTKIVCKN